MTTDEFWQRVNEIAHRYIDTQNTEANEWSFKNEMINLVRQLYASGGYLLDKQEDKIEDWTEVDFNVTRLDYSMNFTATRSAESYRRKNAVMTKVVLEMVEKTKVKKELDLTFPLYLYYESDGDGWRRYIKVKRVEADGTYTELGAQQSFHNATEYNIEKNKSSLAMLLPQYLQPGEYGHDYRYDNDSKIFDELHAEILEAMGVS